MRTANRISPAVWKRGKSYFAGRPRRGGRPPATWRGADDLLEALFAQCGGGQADEPLKAFLAIGDVDRDRPAPLDAAIVARLAREYGTYGSQYVVFSESRLLSGQSIGGFLDAASAISRAPDVRLRADAAGSFQALIGLFYVYMLLYIPPEEELAEINPEWN